MSKVSSFKKWALTCANALSVRKRPIRLFSSHSPGEEWKIGKIIDLIKLRSFPLFATLISEKVKNLNEVEIA
jgi:hypothetical protein